MEMNETMRDYPTRQGERCTCGILDNCSPRISDPDANMRISLAGRDLESERDRKTDDACNRVGGVGLLCVLSFRFIVHVFVSLCAREYTVLSTDLSVCRFDEDSRRRSHPP